MEGGSPGAMTPDRRQDPHQDHRGAHAGFGEERVDEPGVLAESTAARIVAGFKALAGLLAAVLLVPAMRGHVAREPKQPDALDPATATRDGE